MTFEKTKQDTSIIAMAPRSDFPVLNNYPKLAYLDTAVTSQQPQSVIHAAYSFAESNHASINRGVYALSDDATKACETARKSIANFIGARGTHEISFTANATGALNTIAYILQQRLKKDDEIILTVAEHHSNIVPWQRVVRETGAKIVWVTLADDMQFPLDNLKNLLTKKTKVLAIAHVSNVLGYVAPLSDLAALAHNVGAHLVVDAAQSVGHMPFNVQEMGIDYAAFSGHKMYGPSGIGWLFGREELLNDVEPLLVGSGSILEVTKNVTTWQTGGSRFEAGTQNLEGIIGLAAAISYLKKLGMENVWQHEQSLTAYALTRLSEIENLVTYGPVNHIGRAGVLSFEMSVGGKKIHSHDIAQIADNYNVALRSGHHCAQILMKELGLTDLTRASLGLYTSSSDIDSLVSALYEARKIFS